MVQPDSRWQNKEVYAVGLETLGAWMNPAGGAKEKKKKDGRKDRTKKNSETKETNEGEESEAK